MGKPVAEVIKKSVIGVNNDDMTRIYISLVNKFSIKLTFSG